MDVVSLLSGQDPGSASVLSYDTINGETITPLALGVSEPYYLLQPQEWLLRVQITE